LILLQSKRRPALRRTSRIRRPRRAPHFYTVSEWNSAQASKEETMISDIESRVSRKLMLRIIPFVMLLYFVSFLDRVSFWST
jgi:hypothetical protein